MSQIIHPSAVIGKNVNLGEGVEIGPYCIIEDDVTIGDGTRLMAHDYIATYTEIGKNNTVFPFATLGVVPQDLKFTGGHTKLVIGNENVIREYCSFHRGTEKGGSVTRIGSRNLFMGTTHIAHDCQVGDDNIFSQAATLAGHVHVGSKVTLGGYSGVHQFCHLGNYAFIGGYSVIVQDALPFVKAVGNRAKNYGINTVGLERQGFTKEEIRDLQAAYKIIFHKKLRLQEALDLLKETYQNSDKVMELVHFIESSERGITH